jgi:uncharacterized phiE125 gp8 family phage protein
MPAILTSPPALEPVSLDDAKAHLRLVQNDDDPLISTLIIAARRRIEAETGLALIAQGWSCYRDDWPDDGLVELPVAPLIAVTRVTTYADDDTAADIDPAHYYVDSVSTPPRLALRGSRAWPRPGRVANGIEIAVTAGFGSAALAVPEDIRNAVLQLVAHLYENRGTGKDAGLPLTVAAALARYRVVRL